tara:strand:+ start:1838 stop:2053 length:216 start_codon:yes stop_codon:yes gene_type:complete
MSEDQTKKQYVDINVISEYFGISKQTISKWVQAGNIPDNTYIKVGDTYRYNLEAVEKALVKRTQSEDTEVT